MTTCGAGSTAARHKDLSVLRGFWNMNRKDLGVIEEKQLDFIEYLDSEMVNKHGTELKYMVSGGIAVAGHCGEFYRTPKNVDIMLPKENIDKFMNTLYGYGMDVNPEGKNLIGEGNGVKAYAVILYPIGNDYTFETPYHNPGAPVPKRFLNSERVRLHGIEFPALNATALYFAKLGAASRTPHEKSRDDMDLKKLARFVDGRLREEMRAYARV